MHDHSKKTRCSCAVQLQQSEGDIDCELHIELFAICIKFSYRRREIQSVRRFRYQQVNTDGEQHPSRKYYKTENTNTSNFTCNSDLLDDILTSSDAI